MLREFDTDSIRNSGVVGNKCPASYVNGGAAICSNSVCSTTCNLGYSFDFTGSYCRSTSSDTQNWFVIFLSLLPVLSADFEIVVRLEIFVKLMEQQLERLFVLILSVKRRHVLSDTILLLPVLLV